LQSTYEALIADLKEQIEKREVTIEAFEKKISVSFVDRILFDFGKETITPEGEAVLQKVGGILRDVQGRRIRVIGHTDHIPILPKYRYRFPSNWELSAARAAAVVRHFEKKTGLDPRNLEAVGRSFYHPVASNETADGRSQNRRVEIIIAPQLK
jgi:chemotaxis protein MotB